MKIYGIKMHNFMRFGESDNSIVFNVTEDQKNKIQNGELTFDNLYNSLSNDPLKYIDEVNAIEDDNVLEGIVGISGMTSGSFDNSNGSGKSTIFEAISFLFYEKIVRQTANNDKKSIAGLSVVTKLAGKYPENLKESFVEAYFEEDKRLYRVKRGRSFTKTKKSSTPIFEFDCIKDNEVDSLSSHRKKDTKRSLEEVIVEDYDIFVNTVMFGQSDAGKFLTGTDKTKKDMIIELLKLEDVVHGCIEVVRNRKKEENDKLNNIISKENAFKGLVVNTYNEFKDVLPESEEHVEYSVDLIDTITNLINSEIDKGNILKNKTIVKIEDIEKDIQKLEDSDVIKKIKAITEEGKKLVEDKKNKEDKKNAELRDWIKVLSDSKNNLLSSEKRIKSITYDIEGYKTKLREFENRVASFDEENYKEQITKCERAESLESKYRESLEEIESRREKVLIQVSEFEAAINIRSKDLVSLENQIKNAGSNDKFLCRECHSVVTKEHTINKINEIKEIIQKNESGSEQVKNRLKKLDEARISVKEKLIKIENYKLEHQKLITQKNLSDTAKNGIFEVKDSIDKCNKSISDEKMESELINKKIEEQQKKCDSIEENFKKTICSIIDLINDKKSEIIKLKESAGQIEEKIKEHVENKNKLLLIVADFDKRNGSLQEKLEQVIDLGNKISEVKNKIDISNKELNRLKILENAFGLEGVQTKIVAKYLPLLNMYIKQFLDTLSNGKLIIDLFINDKSKVDMSIVGGTADNYIMLSGGEKMIVRLAVDVGLSLLSFSRTARTPDMICLDEIFGPLDPEHTKSVFKMLDKLKDRFKRVYIISHKSEIQGLVKNNIIIEKDSGNRGLSKIIGICEFSV